MYIRDVEIINNIVEFSDTSNPNYEYVGNGLSDGNCGIKIKNANFADTGKWKCKIGNNNTYDLEYIYNINVHGK